MDPTLDHGRKHRSRRNRIHVLDMVMDDQQLSTRVIAARISQERADHILHNELVIKVSARWITRLLMHDQMRTSANLSRDNLT